MGSNEFSIDSKPRQSACLSPDISEFHCVLRQGCSLGGGGVRGEAKRHTTTDLCQPTLVGEAEQNVTS